MFTHVLLAGTVAAIEGGISAVLIPRKSWAHIGVLLVSALGVCAALAHAHGVALALTYGFVSFVLGMGFVIAVDNEFVERRARNRLYRQIRRPNL